MGIEEKERVDLKTQTSKFRRQLCNFGEEHHGSEAVPEDAKPLKVSDLPLACSPA